jgi:HSP20 family molecular chaperone IbpA
MRNDALDLFEMMFSNNSCGLKFDTSLEYTIKEGSIKIDLKGAKKENVNVTVSGSDITVVATKKNIHDKETKYEKTFILGDKHDPSTVSATYEDSILTITADLYKSERTRTITIK